MHIKPFGVWSNDYKRGRENEFKFISWFVQWNSLELYRFSTNSRTKINEHYIIITKNIKYLDALCCYKLLIWIYLPNIIMSEFPRKALKKPHFCFWHINLHFKTADQAPKKINTKKFEIQWIWIPLLWDSRVTSRESRVTTSGHELSIQSKSNSQRIQLCHVYHSFNLLINGSTPFRFHSGESIQSENPIFINMMEEIKIKFFLSNQSNLQPTRIHFNTTVDWYKT